jgi:cell division protein FtsQ
MARKSGSTIMQEELYPPSAEPGLEYARPERPAYERPSDQQDRVNRDLDDARLVDLDVDEESPFLRAQKRVSARRSSLPKKTASRLLWVVITAAILSVAAIAAAGLYQYGEHSWRFRIQSSDNIEIAGIQNVTRAQIVEVMGADIGRNIFFVPLAQQKAQLEQIPWVESASVMRFVPNRLRVEIQERTPVAFAHVGPHILLIDAGGTLMERPPKGKFSFPVILGMNPGEPLSTRQPRMKAYNELIAALDAEGGHYSQDLSEVDLSDLDNLKVRVNDPAGDVLVELGSSDYLKRYKIYVSHVQEWRQQFQKLESVNLRYDNQVIVNPDLEGRVKQVPLSTVSAKAAIAAGVKPAALATNANAHLALPKPAFELSEKKLDPKAPSAKKPAAKGGTRKAKAKQTRAAMQKPAAREKQPVQSTTTAPKPAASAAASATSGKPSPGIAKQ